MTWDDVFTNWAKGPSETESKKCDNAEKIICDALNNDPSLWGMKFRVFTQGSYKARTNVRLDSDVNICILNTNAIFYDAPPGVGNADVGLIDLELTYGQFKNLVEQALVRKFGRQGVTRGNKAFDVHANSYRVDADVVPAFEHRRYTKNLDGTYSYISGIEFRPDKGGRVINWPDQTYDNGVAKNSATSRRYKRTIRVLKRLRNAMQEKNVAAAKNIGSFLIESLVWNVPDSAFLSDSYYSNLRTVFVDLFNDTLRDETCKEWGEVNELKYLFRSQQPWSRDQAHHFISAAWDYVGYK